MSAFNDEGRRLTVTDLERHTDAYVACLCAWIYPSDVEARKVALQAAAICGIDYLEVVARIMESTSASADTARLNVAGYFGRCVSELVAKGEAPRPGVAMSGYRTDALGNDTYPGHGDE